MEVLLKIGDFAALCGTTISVLRYYDQIGLLRPVYIDYFSGYRYYDEEQRKDFSLICTLKNAGFSLEEIKELIKSDDTEEKITSAFLTKKDSLVRQLEALEKAETELIKGLTDKKMENKDYMHDNICMPFENDEKVIGKWQVLGSWDSKESWSLSPDSPIQPPFTKEFYFLPEGTRYWCYGWTKGKILFDNGRYQMAYNYEVNLIGGEILMFIEERQFDSGKTYVTVLKKKDDIRYTLDMITKKDNLDMPFEDDPAVIGSWKSVGFIKTGKELSEDCIDRDRSWFFSKIVFKQDGHADTVIGGKLITGDDKQTWTKGYLLRKYNSNACAYIITELCGMEYLVIEWKSGDYRWGALESDHYIFERLSD